MSCGPCGIRLKNRGSMNIHKNQIHEDRGCKCHRCKDVGGIKQVNDNTVELDENLEKGNHINKEVPRCKSLTCDETRCEDAGEVLDDTMEVSLKMIGEVVKVNVMQKAKPKAHDLIIMCFKRRLICSECDFCKCGESRAKFNFNIKLSFSFKILFKLNMKFVFVETGNYFCSDCDPCGLIMEASSYLQQVKKEINHVKLELNYAHPTWVGGRELLASVIFKL